MQEVRPARVVSQRVVRGAHVQDDGVRGGVGDGEQVRRTEVGEEHAPPLFDERRGPRGDVLVLGQLHVLEAVLVTEKPTGGPVVLEPELGAGEALVVDAFVDERERHGRLDVAREPDDVELERRGGAGRARERHRERDPERPEARRRRDGRQAFHAGHRQRIVNSARWDSPEVPGMAIV